MNETLLILHKDKRVVDNWVREWGIRLKNVSYVPIKSEEEAKGWDKKGTFYMIMPEWNDSNGLLSFVSSKYRRVEKDNFEKKVKKIKSPSF